MHNASSQFNYRYTLLQCRKEVGKCLHSQGEGPYSVGINSEMDQEIEAPKQYRVMMKTQLESLKDASSKLTKLQMTKVPKAKPGWVNIQTAVSPRLSEICELDGTNPNASGDHKNK